MTEVLSHAERIQTPHEETLNALSHGFGLLLALVSLPILLVPAMQKGTTATVLAVVLYSSTMMLLYLASTIYHALPHGAWKRRFNRLDHASIYLFIAGSYTPFALGPLAGPIGWTLAGVVWMSATVGTLAKLLNRLQHPLWSTGLYVLMGWGALFAVVPMFQRIGSEGMALLIAGGVAYTVGAVFFLLDNKYRYAHFIWHLFVLAGSGFHLVAALLYGVVKLPVA